MSHQDVPTSVRIRIAQQQRIRHRRGVLRAKIIGGVFGAALVFGFIGGCGAPGAA